nr:reverse transcriptase domain-containing protein [Tanacetum cinerariifolium]
MIYHISVYLWSRGRNVLRVHSQHQGTESVFRQSRRCPESSIPKIFERRTKVKWKARRPKQVLAKSAEKSLPFFKTFKKCMKKSDFYWTAEAKEAFKQMKQLIAELPMLTAPVEKEELIVYLEAIKEKGIKRSGDKLYINGEIIVGLGTYQQAPKEILSSITNHSSYRLANTIGVIKTESSREAIKVEHQIRRIEPLADKLGLNELQPHVDQLMVPIHHLPDKVVSGATILSLALDVSSIRVRKIKKNIATQRSVLYEVFAPLSEPFSVAVLTGIEGTSNVMPTITDTTMALSITFASASTIAPISVDDYEVVDTNDQEDADGNVEPFPNVDDAKLNIPQ